MTARRFTVVLELAEEGGFVAKCVELPVSSQGGTKKEALANIKEAIEGYLEVKAELFRDSTSTRSLQQPLQYIEDPPPLQAKERKHKKRQWSHPRLVHDILFLLKLLLQQRQPSPKILQ